MKKEKNITDWFDKVYVINCAHRPDRRERLLKHFEETGIADINKVTIYPGVIGDYTGHPAGWGAGNGAWGCLQSHRRLMEDLMHIRDERHDIAWDSALIMEDDVYFLDGAIQQLNEFMAAVPNDWGQIYLGGQHRGTCTATSSPHVFVGASINRTHAYAVSRRHIKTIYQHISYMADYHSCKHVDHQLELAHQRKDWPVYCPPKWICGQCAGPSNVSGNMDDDRTWNPID